LFKNVCSRFLDNSPRLEITQVSTDRRMYENYVEYYRTKE
jgi:hypothetical protein